ncbi:MAG: PRC-barrel domain containing protein [Anaerolineaceae bacterium]|jgi:sporulation protein YlmC with PRC-barrel domain|nr:PRC-barrel domain-containing protein [Anaerolineae bacterium]MDX9833124.1 PRC-barrel domain-containing protein [Anaerolineae bacterium]NLF13700.1 PRC-barrel domain containing protein [Anaerolineaceae bacterium]
MTYQSYSSTSTSGRSEAEMMSATTLIGDRVRNMSGEDLGKLEEIMLDMDGGRVAYAVLSFGGVLGMGNKLFAVPWDALTVDTENKELVLNIDRETLENAPGFDKDNWPGTETGSQWLVDVYDYYGYEPYWTR